MSFSVVVEPSGEFKKLRVALISEDGSIHRYVKKPGDDFTGEPQEVLDARDEHHTPEVLAAYQQHLANEAAAAILTHEQYRTNGLRKIDDVHAEFMRTLTGDATIEERDTWVTKAAAAAYVTSLSDTDLTAAVTLVTSDDLTANPDLETLVHDVGTDVTDLRDLAVTILTKSRAYKRLVGIASRIRREAKDAVTAATEPDVDINGVGAALDVIEATMLSEVQTAIASWQGA